MTLDLGAIQARADAATGTRYGASSRDEHGGILWATADDMSFVHLADIYPETSQADLNFLVHAREDVSALVAEVLQLQTKLGEELELRIRAVTEASESDRNNAAVIRELLALVDPVITRTGDQIGTHSDRCYEYHLGCLAVAIRGRIAGPEPIHAEKESNR